MGLCFIFLFKSISQVPLSFLHILNHCTSKMYMVLHPGGIVLEQYIGWIPNKKHIHNFVVKNKDYLEVAEVMT